MSGFKKILVPTDFSAASTFALEYATQLAKRLGASINILHVIEDPFVAGAWSSEIYVAEVPQLRAAIIQEAEKRLENALSPADRKTFSVTSDVMTGSPASTIAKVAEERHIDLIVMGTHGRSGMAHLLLGSVAEKVVRIASCPVLTIRGEAREAGSEEAAISQHSAPPAVA